MSAHIIQEVPLKWSQSTLTIIFLQTCTTWVLSLVGYSAVPPAGSECQGERITPRGVNCRTSHRGSPEPAGKWCAITDTSQIPPKGAPEKQTLRQRFLCKWSIKKSSQGRPTRKWAGWQGKEEIRWGCDFRQSPTEGDFTRIQQGSLEYMTQLRTVLTWGKGLDLHTSLDSQDTGCPRGRCTDFQAPPSLYQQVKHFQEPKGSPPKKRLGCRPPRDKAKVK